MNSEDAVKEIYPHAHCAPLAHASYPEFYVIRATRSEWAESLATGQTPDSAWRNARNGMPHICGACGCRRDSDGCGCNPEGA